MLHSHDLAEVKGLETDQTAFAGHRTLSTAYLQIEAVVEAKSGFSDKVGRLSRRWQAAALGRPSEKKRKRIADRSEIKVYGPTSFFQHDALRSRQLFFPCAVGIVVRTQSVDDVVCQLIEGNARYIDASKIDKLRFAGTSQECRICRKILSQSG